MSDYIEFPIFPLDSVILVPGGMLPLHIFEPRYREMVADALIGDRRVAMALPLTGHSCADQERPPVHEVCGLGVIVRHQPYEDGRSDIVLRGQRRMRIVEEIRTDRPYRMVRGETLEDIYPDDVDLEPRARDLLRRLEGLPEDDRRRLEKLTVGRLVDAVLGPLPLPILDKQRIHACADVLRRLDRLEALLDLLQGSRYRLELNSDDPRLN